METGRLPLYWVQLADYRDEAPRPDASEWAELREAQTIALDRLVNTGQAVITDLGEAHDIHPKNKQDVAKRLARLALADLYDQDIVARSPRFQEMSKNGNKIVLSFKEVGSSLDTVDVETPLGFTIAGEDRHFVPAKATIIAPHQVAVWSEAIDLPLAVRYAWADNPLCNMQNQEGLPLTPFRTDDWPGVTAENH